MLAFINRSVMIIIYPWIAVCMLPVFAVSRNIFKYISTCRQHLSIYRTQVPLPPKTIFLIFSQQIYIFLNMLHSLCSFPPHNAMYFLMLSFLVHKISTFFNEWCTNIYMSGPVAKGLMRSVLCFASCFVQQAVFEVLGGVRCELDVSCGLF